MPAVLAILVVLISPVQSESFYANGTTGCNPFADNQCKSSGFTPGRCFFDASGNGISSESREVKPNARTCYNTEAEGTVYYLANANAYNGWNPGMSDWCCAYGQDFAQGIEGNLHVIRGARRPGFCECTVNNPSKCAGGQSYICNKNPCTAAESEAAIQAYLKVKDKCTGVTPYGFAPPTPAPAPPPPPSSTPRRRRHASPRPGTGRRRRRRLPTKGKSSTRRRRRRRRRAPRRSLMERGQAEEKLGDIKTSDHPMEA